MQSNIKYIFKTQESKLNWKKKKKQKQPRREMFHIASIFPGDE